MAKLNCVCGWQISNICSPNDFTGSIINDHQEEEFYEKPLEDFVGRLRWIWECVQCGRIAIDESVKDNKVVWFEPVDKKYVGVLRGNI